eukprot:TRINITY_DN757_c1_g3_i1.p1 TRINITY_DN757_c1_g3~~TRINITY_DN757_c1_g3_i1.p1  ORF type:complete len:388 (+),score=132.57 TRINITY_DN757_c1_g3_i1:85-1248(+)
MDDQLQKSMAERVLRMRAQAHGRRGGGGGVMRTTNDAPKSTYVPSIKQAKEDDAPGHAGAKPMGIGSGGGFGPKPTTSHGHDDSDEEGAEKLRQKLKSMGISESITPMDNADTGGPGAGPSVSLARDQEKIDVSDKRSFLGRAPPKVGMVCCYVMRDRAGMKKLHPEYHMYLENPGESSSFLLAARKRKNKKTSNYLISMDPDDLCRQSGNFYGKVRGNFLGTEFTVYDRGEKPSKDGGLAFRQELAAVLYEPNVMGSKGPRRMIAIVPSVDASGKRVPWKPESTEDSESLISAYKEKERESDMMILENKRPTWDEKLRAFVLDFKGRVTVASVKNFQLVERGTDKVLVQFGKVFSDKFTLDFQYPITGLQAFCIALTAFDNKLACD